MNKALKIMAFLSLALLLGTTACSKKGGDGGDAKAVTVEAVSGQITAPADAKTVHLIITGNDKMQYDASKIVVHAGQTVKLTLKHVGTQPANIMGHNWVLLKNGVDPAVFSKKAMAAKATDYVPEGSEDVIAHTKIVGGGESTTITFKAPAAGSYHYLCSFPGHHAVMHGTFVVK